MKTLVYLEVRDGEVKKASLEAISEARRLGADVDAVVAGADPGNALDQAAAHGVGKVYVLASDELENYVPEGVVAAIVEAAGQASADSILIAATSQGRDLGPRVAAKMGVMLMPDVTGLKLDGEDLVVTRPVYSGKVYMDLKATLTPVVVSTRPNTFDVEQADGAAERVDISPSFEAKAKVVKVELGSGDTLDVAEADVVVAGGRGLKEPENFKLLEDLASKLNAAVGASRAVVDAGWRPHAEQVGQTGKVVAPTLYFAVGVSGAVQHLAGMRTSKVIVAINKDADAPIFKVADYGIVGDALEVVPALTEAL